MDVRPEERGGRAGDEEAAVGVEEGSVVRGPGEGEGVVQMWENEGGEGVGDEEEGGRREGAGVR